MEREERDAEERRKERGGQEGRGERREEERMADLHNMTTATNRATSSLGLSSPAASAAAACS